MCGRYAFFQRPSAVRQQLQDAHMPSDSAPDDDAARQSYNFAPGYYGLVYRADTSDYGAGPKSSRKAGEQEQDDVGHEGGNGFEADELQHDAVADESTTHYKLQAMRWGLIPSWTKRNPDYGTMMRTINCRDDSLAENRGMWTNMKKKKRCIVICNGFYEWLKKNNGKERIPHYIKRKDGQLMCFAGLWDVVQYEGEDTKNYTYTVITTEGNKQMNFLHDRMPVILDPGSEKIRTWLSPKRYEWTRDLQNLLIPFQGELEIYPVSKEVGKVGNDSPKFIIPIDSTENKSNIANFFSKPDKSPKKSAEVKSENKASSEVEKLVASSQVSEESTVEDGAVEHDPELKIKDENDETNAPMEVKSPEKIHSSLKRSLDKMSSPAQSPEKEAKQAKNQSTPNAKSGRKVHSAISNGTIAKSPEKGASNAPKITSFFGKQS